MGRAAGYPEVGESVGGYAIEAVLGSGGFGVVCRARGPQGGCVALKALLPQARQDAGMVERFHLEATILRLLRHPGIVRVYDVIEDALYGDLIVMELIEGRSLEARIDVGGALEPGEVRRMARQTLEALQAAHEARFIHRDIKPANIMLVESGGEPSEVRLIDFGIAKPLAGENVMTAAGQVMGSPQYIAPERIKGEIGPRADLYALGLVMAEALTGKPVVAWRENPVDMIRQHMASPPHELPSDLPVDLARVIARAIAKDPEARYGSAAEMLRALKVARSPTVVTDTGAGAADKGQERETLVGGRYRLDQVHAENDWSRIFEGHDAVLGRPVWVKLMREGVDPGLRSERRFEREASVAPRLQHPGLACVIDAGVTLDKGIPWIVTERLPGASLDTRLTGRGQSPMGQAEAIEIAAQVLDALGVAHQQGIIHRNIKPSKVWLCEGLRRRRQIKLMDFGLAREVAQDAAALTQQGKVFGTWRFMAPEQLMGGEQGPGVDVYAVAMTLVEMLLDRPLLETRSPQLIVRWKMADVALPEEIQGPLRGVLERALARDPAARHPDAGAMLEALEAASRPAPVASPGLAPTVAVRLAQWPMQGGEGHRRGCSPQAGPAVGAVAWRAELGMPVRAAPVIGAGGEIYVAGAQGRVCAVAQGRIRWSVELPELSAPCAPTLCQGGQLAVAGLGGAVRIFEGASGRLLGAAALGRPLRAALACDQLGAVLVGGEDGRLTSLWEERVRWSLDLGASVQAPVMVVGDRIVVGTTDGQLHAVDGQGVRLWSVGLEDRAALAPVAGPEGTILVARADGVVCALEGVGAGGGVRWSARLGWEPALAMALGGASGLVVATEAEIVALDPASGGRRWARALDGRCLGLAIDASGIVLGTTDKGSLWALDPEAGQPLWRCAIGGGRLLGPVIGEGGACVVSEEGRVCWVE